MMKRAMSAKTIHDRRREGIIAAMRDLFRRKGFYGTSMSDGVRAVAISIELIYYFSPKKEHLISIANCQSNQLPKLLFFSFTL